MEPCARVRRGKGRRVFVRTPLLASQAFPSILRQRDVLHTSRSVDRILRTVLRTEIDGTVMLRILHPEREPNVSGKSRDIRLNDPFGKGESFAPSEAGTRLGIEADRFPSLMKRRPNIAPQHNPSLALGDLLGRRA